MINIQLTYHGHPIYQICFLNTVMPVALTLTNNYTSIYIYVIINNRKQIHSYKNNLAI